jgi:CubicO group peptidase (beta-lactamase class C family)
MKKSVVAMVFCGGFALWGLSMSPADSAEATAAALVTGEHPTGLVDNSQFVPADNASPALEPFIGSIQLAEAEMSTEPMELKSRNVLGKDPKIFPGVTLSFFTHEGDLVPVTQDVIRYGSTPAGRSYWDVIVQPGRIWSMPEDDGWSRASFPFSLVHSIEGETHNGVAMFAYKGDQISNLRFQITQQTSPYYIEDFFKAYGIVPAKWTREAPEKFEPFAETYKLSVASSLKLRPWSELESKFGKEKLMGFDNDIKPSELVADGLAIGSDFYLHSCPSAAGELAYCDRQRFGVWSVTKAAANTVALLRLAEKYGPNVFKEKLVDHVTEAKDVKGWENATFGDLLNMASGLGNGTDKRDPNNISDGYLDPTYPAWYEAKSEAEKIQAVLRDSKVYPWGPGQVARYRDEDMFLLGVAMKRYLRAKEGNANADIWEMLRKEVYQPIGVHYAPTNKTIEANEADAQPLMAYGFYPTISDLVKIAQLFQNGGAFEGTQILNKEMLADILPGLQPRGLPTGDAELPFYRKGFWHATFQSNDCSIFYPVMSGWGANFVPIFSKDVLAIRLAKNWDGDESADKLRSLMAVANNVQPVCSN